MHAWLNKARIALVKLGAKKLPGMLGRVIRDIQRKSQQLQLPATEQARLSKLLEIASRINSQQRVRAEGAPPKIYSVDAPEVECIAKGQGARAVRVRCQGGVGDDEQEVVCAGGGGPSW